MNPKDLYSDTQRDKYVELAVKIGLYAAMRELGYPKSRLTAAKWLEARNLQTPGQADYEQYPDEEQTTYSKAKQLKVLGALLNQLQDLLDSDLLEADEISKVAHAAEKAISAIRLIENKPTHISAQSLPPEAQEMLDRLAGANEAALARARAPQSLKQILELSPIEGPAQN